MNALELSLTQDERGFLISLLESALKEKRVEEHRTKKLEYRQIVIADELHLQNILAKLHDASE